MPAVLSMCTPSSCVLLASAYQQLLQTRGTVILSINAKSKAVLSGTAVQHLHPAVVRTLLQGHVCASSAKHPHVCTPASCVLLAAAYQQLLQKVDTIAPSLRGNPAPVICNPQLLQQLHTLVDEIRKLLVASSALSLQMQFNPAGGSQGGAGGPGGFIGYSNQGAGSSSGGAPAGASGSAAAAAAGGGGGGGGGGGENAGMGPTGAQGFSSQLSSGELLEHGRYTKRRPSIHVPCSLALCSYICDVCLAAHWHASHLA